MTMVDKIDLLMVERGIKTRKELSRLADIPYTTIISLYDKSENAKRSTLLKLADFFECSLDYLITNQLKHI